MKKRLTAVLAGVALALLAVAGASCSLDVPKPGADGQLNVVIEKSRDAFEDLTRLLGPPFMPLMFSATPSTLGDFTCFGVNVSGSGITPDSVRLRGCTVSSGITIGKLSDLVPANTSVQMSVTAGPARTVSVFGIFPSTTISECGGSSGGSGGNGGSGYILGSKTVDLIGDETVTIGTSYGGQAAAVSCSGGSGGGSSFSSFTLIQDGSSSTGVYAAPCFASSSISTSSPAPGSLSPVTSLGAGDYAVIGSQDATLDTQECTASGANDTEVIVYTFAAGSNPTSGATQVQVTYVGAAGLDAGCSVGSPAGGGGGSPRVEVWDSSGPGWTTVGTLTTGNAAVQQTFSNAQHFISSGQIFVRVVGVTATTSICSEIQTDFVSVTVL